MNGVEPVQPATNFLLPPLTGQLSKPPARTSEGVFEFSDQSGIDRCCGVYFIRNKDSGKHYVGSSKNIAIRLMTHRGQLRLNKHHSKKLQNAFNKYGESAFCCGILLTCSVERLESEENKFIALLDAVRRGFNVKPQAFSNSGMVRTAAWKRRVKASNDFMWGETLFGWANRKRLSNMFAGKKRGTNTNESNKKRSESLRKSYSQGKRKSCFSDPGFRSLIKAKKDEGIRRHCAENIEFRRQLLNKNRRRKTPAAA